MHCHCLLLLLLPHAVASAQAPPHAAPGEGATDPRLELAALPVELPASLRDSVRFGYITVPREHGQANGDSLRLALAILSSHASHPAPDPIIFVPGGPGMSVIEPWLADAASSPRIGLLRARRAFIILEPRGHGMSDPPPCEGLDGAEPLVEDSPAAEAILSDWLAKCRRQWAEAGYRPATLNAIEAARDIDRLRSALGAPQVNLLGASYGSRIVAEAMRQVPSAVRSAILLGPVPPGLLHVGDEDAVAPEVLRTLVARCAERLACRQEYPGLASELDSVLARVRRAPVRVRMPRSTLLPEGEIRLDEKRLRAGLAQLLTSRELAGALPLVVHTLATRGMGSLERLGPHLASAFTDDDVAFGTFLAFTCNDLPPSTAVPSWLTARCRTWIDGAAVHATGAPLQSAIPALVMVGELDPRTPPRYAGFVMRGLSRGHLVTIPWLGHDYQHPCLSRIQRDFFETPLRPPRTDCLDSIGPIHFVRGVAESRWVANAILRAADDPLRFAIPPVAALAMLLIPVIGIPLRDHWPSGMTGGLRRASLALWLAAATAVMLILGVAGAALAGARQHPIVPALGVPSGWKWVIGFPWVVVFLALAAVVGSMRAREPEDQGVLTWLAAGGASIVLGLWVIHALV